MDSTSSLLGDLPVRERRPLEAYLPLPASKSQSLIELLTGKLISGADTITLPKDQVLEIIQHLSYPEKSEAAVSCSRELAEVKEELKTIKAHCRLGDYAGKVFNDLKHLAWDSKVRMRAEDLAEELEQDVTRGYDGKAARTIQDAFDNIPPKLQRSSEMTFDTAKHALQDQGHWDELAQRISKDLTELPEYLPDDQLQHQTHWRSIITYFKDSYITFSEELQAYDGIPEKDLFKPADSTRPIDCTTLPKDLREIPFNTGEYRDFGSEAAEENRYLNMSDPIQAGKRKRDEADAEADAEAVAEAVAKAVAEAIAEAVAEADAEADAEAVAKAVVKAMAEVEAEAMAEADAETDAESLEGEPPTKIPRLDFSEPKSSGGGNSKEEYLRFLWALQQFRDKFPVGFKTHMQLQLSVINVELGRLQETDVAVKGRGVAKAKRAARVAAR